MNNTDSTKTILRSAQHFFSGTMLSRISGMLRDIVMAFAFGTHASIAAFLVAFRFSHLLRRLLGEGALQSALIPQFETLRQENPQRAVSFFRSLTLSLSLLLLCIVILTMGTLWSILSYIPLDPENQEILQLTLLMMPSLIFICLFGINASLLQCEKKYFTPSVAPVAFNLLWILGMILVWNLPPEQAMRWLTLFVNLACIAQWAMTFPQTQKTLKTLGTSFSTLFSHDVRSLIKPLSLGIVGIGASQVNNALDAIFARYADSEGPAYLWYAIRLQQLPLALFGVAISGAMLPPLSRAIKSGNLEQYREFLDYALRKSLMLILPITLAIFVLGDSCINLLYGHGDFDSHAIAETTYCLWAYGSGLFPMAIVLILAPAFYAQNDYKTPTQSSIISIALNIFLNFFLVSILGFGAASIAVATSLSAWVNMGLLAYQLQKQTNYVPSVKFKSSFWNVAGASTMAAFTVWNYSDTMEIFWKGDIPQWPREIFTQLRVLSMQTVLFFSCLASISYLLRKLKLRQGQTEPGQ